MGRFVCRSKNAELLRQVDFFRVAGDEYEFSILPATTYHLIRSSGMDSVILLALSAHRRLFVDFCSRAVEAWAFRFAYSSLRLTICSTRAELIT